jgi:uncharacterized membrane protein (DUF106 family)
VKKETDHLQDLKKLQVHKDLNHHSQCNPTKNLKDPVLIVILILILILVWVVVVVEKVVIIKSPKRPSVDNKREENI